MTDPRIRTLRTMRLAVRALTVGLLVVGGGLVAWNAPQLKFSADLGFRIGMWCLVAAATMFTAWAGEVSRQAVQTRLLMKSDQAVARSVGSVSQQLREIEAFERRQIEVLAYALDEIPARTRADLRWKRGGQH